MRTKRISRIINFIFLISLCLFISSGHLFSQETEADTDINNSPGAQKNLSEGANSSSSGATAAIEDSEKKTDSAVKPEKKEESSTIAAAEDKSNKAANEKKEKSVADSGESVTEKKKVAVAPVKKRVSSDLNFDLLPLYDSTFNYKRIPGYISNQETSGDLSSKEDQLEKSVVSDKETPINNTENQESKSKKNDFLKQYKDQVALGLLIGLLLIIFFLYRFKKNRKRRRVFRRIPGRR